jgi:hypothetical protein
MFARTGWRGHAAQIGAETVARALKGRKRVNGWTARCPAHDDRNPLRIPPVRARILPGGKRIGAEVVARNAIDDAAGDDPSASANASFTATESIEHAAVARSRTTRLTLRSLPQEFAS